MKIIEPGYEILRPKNIADARDDIYQMIEIAGRTCYTSEEAITPDSAARFVKMVVDNNHDAMLEHAFMTVRFTVDRGVSHEIVRHRLASFAQESTRYCNYSRGKFGSELTFIRPCFLTEGTAEYKLWAMEMMNAEETYMAMLEKGCTPQEARDVLPTSVRTRLVMTANMREWRHFFGLRAAGETGAPHPQMAQVAVPLLQELQSVMPELFGDIKLKEVSK